MRRAVIVFSSVALLAACGGSTLRKAPQVSSLKACAATRDAARAASAVVYATTSSYPTSFTAMTTSNPPVLMAGDGTTVTARSIEGKGWTLTMRGGGKTEPTFTCAQSGNRQTR